MAEEARRMPIGGQAVIEGVLMKGKDLWGLAVRRPDGTIFRESWNNSSRIGRYPWKLPLLQGGNNENYFIRSRLIKINGQERL